MAAITQRGKRKTAGKRMSSLVGKAQEEDDTFWGHDTWADDGDDSGNESFRDSDEESAAKKDEFDSDFDESESDREEEEKAAGQEEEQELKRQERSKSKGKGYMEAPTNRGITKGKGKRVVGDGMNAGIVLNFPGSKGGGAPLPTPVGAPLPSTAATTPPPPKKPSPKKAAKRITMASTRTKRSATTNKRLRESTAKASEESQTSAKKATKTGTGTGTGGSKRSGKRRYTQEEMLLEAVHKTEPENKRWLLERKRTKDIEDSDRAAMALREKKKGPVVEKYHSKRGSLKTLTYPNMDAVPELFTRKKVVLKKPKKTFCVVTGKRARYKDPKTNLGYFDLPAFKELRRRMEANEPLDQRKKPPPKAKPATNDTGSNVGKEETKTAGAAPKPTPNGVPPTDVAPTTPKTTATVKTLPGNASSVPNVPTLSPSERRMSPRSRKPTEKMRENIASSPQLNNLVKLNVSNPANPALAMPADSINNTKSSSTVPGPVPKPSPPGTNGNAKKKSTTTQPTSEQSDQKTTSVGAKVKHATPPVKPKTKPTESAPTTKPPIAAKPSGGETSSSGNKRAVEGQKEATQSQLIMQVINDFNQQHPEVKE